MTQISLPTPILFSIFRPLSIFVPYFGKPWFRLLPRSLNRRSALRKELFKLNSGKIEIGYEVPVANCRDNKVFVYRA